MRLRFDDFELDACSGELWRGAEPLALPPQPARLLAILVAANGRLVRREDLRAQIWGESFLDWESGLHQAIRRIRLTLGDSATAPRYIETVPRRGYRFIAPLEAVPDPDSPTLGAPLAASGPAAPEPVIATAAGSASEPRPRLARRLGLGAAILSLVGALLLYASTRQAPGSASLDKEAGRLHAEGLHYLAQGRFLEAEQRLRRAAELAPAWSSPWSALAEVELAQPRPGRVARARGYLEGALSRDREDLAAWRQLARLRMWQAWDWTGGRAALEQALEIDAEDAETWQLIAALETVEQREGPALEAAHRALELDPLQTSLRVDLGWTLYYFDHAEQALAECERSLQLEATNRSARQCAVQAALRLGRDEKASALLANEEVEAFYQRQIEALDKAPGCATRAAAAVPLLILGQPEQALQALLAGLGDEKGWALPFARVDPLLAALAGDAEFARIEQALGF